MSRTLRAGIAGYGLAGRVFHANLLQGAGFEVAGVLTNDPTRIRQVHEDLPDARVVPTISSLLDSDLDLLVVASGNSVHAEQAFAAIDAGVPVVVDKPVGLTFDETSRMFAAAAAKSVPLCAFFNRLWDSDTLTLKKVMREGTIGEVFRVDSRFERFRPVVSGASWRETLSPQEGGGVLLDLQTHLLSTALNCFGGAKLAYASVRSIRPGSEDDALLVLNHDSGIDSYLAASAIVGAAGPRLRVNGTAGTLIVHDLDPQEGILRSGRRPIDGKWLEPTATRAFIHRGDEIEEIVPEDGNYPHFYETVRGALQGKNEWPISVAEALAVAEIIDQARAISVR